MFLLKVELTKSNPILGAPFLTSPQILAVEIPQPLSARLFQFLVWELQVESFPAAQSESLLFIFQSCLSPPH